eukprot:gene28262-37180_t
MLRLLSHALVLLIVVDAASRIKEIQQDFLNSFQSRCSKYLFVTKWMKMLDDPPKKHLVFVYHQEARDMGGIGDRLAGLTTAVALSIRYGRNLLLKNNASANGLEKLFRPYHPVKDLNSSKPRFSWEDRNWDTISKGVNMTQFDLTSCPNVEPHTSSGWQCGMFAGDVSEQAVLYSLFASKPSGLSMGESLGVTEQDDLYEVAGCMLRLALWPTNKLWGAVSQVYKQWGRGEAEQVVQSAYHHKQPHQQHVPSSHKSAPMRSSTIQVAVHYRCGDSSFNANQFVQMDSCSRASINYNAHVHSMAACAKDLLFPNSVAVSNSSTTSSSSSLTVEGHARPAMLFVTSDSIAATELLKNEINNTYTLVTPQSSCHIALDLTPQCHLQTITYWFILAQSDVIIQGRRGRAQSVKQAPASGFCNYAGVYGLRVDPFRGVEVGCQTATKNMELGYSTHANWRCEHGREPVVPLPTAKPTDMGVGSSIAGLNNTNATGPANLHRFFRRAPGGAHINRNNSNHL